MTERLEDLLRACTVRVLGGPMPGAGFFVAPGKVLTCFHVIGDSPAAVVRWERDGRPPVEAPVTGTVLVLANRGRPIPALDRDYPDIAVLEVAGLDDHPCVGIDTGWPSHEDSFQVFGYPQEGGAVQLTPARLTYRGAKGILPTTYLDLASDTVKPGMSGAAVLNLRSGAVCGVIVASKHPAHPDGALAIPWSAVGTDISEVLAANRAFHRKNRRWNAAEAAGLTGWPLSEVTDPFTLEVHRPVQPEDAPPGLPVLPPYVPREHDQVLGQVVHAAADGRSGIAVLVGGSSTGKTRACWEALALLQGQDPPWRLWHPIDPSRPDAALRELPSIGPQTVVWLNEAQFYLDTADGLGEKVAAGLRELLRDPGRAPVLVLATMWPQFWHTLTGRPNGGEDPHAQARELLAGHDITVPAAFTPAQMSQLTRAGDVRMVLAARSAPDGEVIQFLAGAPELLARYRNAPPAAKALIHAAMDARRLGTGPGLPHALLEEAAPGYLTDAEWDGLSEDWLEQALAYTAVPCKGARGPLTRIRPRPAKSGARTRGDQPASTAAAAGPVYRLADYLDQHGRTHRAIQIPPAEFWSAAAAHAAPGDQATLGNAAHGRGLYRAAAQLYKNAAAAGNLSAALYLTSPLVDLSADPRSAHWVAAHAAHDDPDAVAILLDSLRHAGADEQAAALLARDLAAHAALDDPRGVARLLDRLRDAGADEQAAALLARDPAAHADLDNPGWVASLLRSLRRAGAHEQAAALLARDPAAHAALDNPRDVSFLLDRLREASAHEQAAALAARAAAHAPVDNPDGVAHLLNRLREAGAEDQAAALAARAAAHADLDNPFAVARLLDSLWRRVPLDDPEVVVHSLDSLWRAGAEAGADEQAAALLARDPAAHAALDDPHGVARLLDSLRRAGADEQAAALLARDPAAHAALDNPDDVASLLNSLREAGADDQAAALGSRAAAHAALDDPQGVASLLDSLREAGADEQAAALLARDPAAHAALDDPVGVGFLLHSLREAGADEQAAALLARDPAAHAALDNPHGVGFLLDSLREAGAHQAAAQAAALASRAAAHADLDASWAVASLLDSLREAGAHEQANTLAARLPAAGMFGIFLRELVLPDQFRFGREADGAPAAPWGWEDLDLWLVPDRGNREATFPSAYRRPAEFAR